MTSQCCLLGVLGLVLGLAGCGGGYDHEFDSLVDEVWLDINAGKLVDATEYLRGDGWHYDAHDTSVDRDLVIPLCQEIEQQHSAKCYGILYDDDSAGEFTSEILVKLSPSSNRNGIRKAIEAADSRFDGRIIQMWGNKWLAFSFEAEHENEP